MSKESSSGGGVSFMSLLFLLFLGLKLTDHIDWSWWWVTSPLWMPLAIVLGIMASVLILMVVGAAVATTFVAIVDGVFWIARRLQ